MPNSYLEWRNIRIIHVFSCINICRVPRKVIKIVAFSMFNFVDQNGVGLQNRMSDDISTNNDVNKSADKILIMACSVLQRNIMQTILGPSWGFSSENHVQTAHEFHDLNMAFAVEHCFWSIWLRLQTALCRATENWFFACPDRFLVCKTDSVCIKCIFFGPKKTHFADHILAQLPGLVKCQTVNCP